MFEKSSSIEKKEKKGKKREGGDYCWVYLQFFLYYLIAILLKNNYLTIAIK
jgi:hypothetical protein